MRALGVLAISLVACASHATQPTVVIQPDDVCGRDRVDHALCVVKRSVDKARKNKDIVKLLCLRDKQAQLEALRGRARSADTDADAARLAREAEYCIGELTASP